MRRLGKGESTAAAAGAWARERAPQLQPLGYGFQSVYSLRGCSSHQFNPFIGLIRPETNEESGEAIGLSLIYSGDFLAAADVDNFNVTDDRHSSGGIFMDAAAR